MFDPRTRQIAIDHHLEFLRKRVHSISDEDVAAIYRAVAAPELLEDGSIRSSVTVQGHLTQYRFVPELPE